MTDWIRCEDRLPEDDKDVLMWGPEIDYDVGHHFEHFDLDIEWIGGEFPYSGSEVSHWMPLPEPPKEA